ncbi:MAG: hypothetical protein DMG06_11200 [Acidobacteria bacterium]|nr:MAG: hypothetical protein DMG06_11200 [Acidobacteriota bacterium]
MDILESDNVDLVITDIMMPSISGFEILRRVKETNELIEVILLTGEAPDKAKPAVSAMQGGAHDYLLKPVNLGELKGAIRGALEKQQLRMDNKRLLQELVQMAHADYLTGLSNQRSFFSLFSQEFERSVRYRRSLSCIFLDVDKFKTINDRHGHRCGDLVLERIGNVLIKHTRVSDIKCRYGGDEFVVVLPEGNQEGTQCLAEKIRHLTENELFDFADQPLKVTVSLGVSVYEVGSHQPASNLLNAADLALLSAKHAGGNRVVFKNVDDLAIRDIVPNTVGI